MKGQISLYRNGIIGEDEIVIRLNDYNSSVRVTEITISMDDFSRLITGLSHTPCEYKILTKDVSLLGKVLKVDSVTMDLPEDVYRPTAEDVEKHFQENFGGTDWILADNGLRVQQHVAHKHTYSIKRYGDNNESKTKKTN